MQISTTKRMERHPTFSLDKLKPFPGTSQFESQNALPPPPTTIVEGQEEHEVERILAHRWMYSKRSKKKELHWLIRWKGYGPHEDTWLSERNINTGGTNSIWKKYEDQRAAKSHQSMSTLISLTNATPSLSSLQTAILQYQYNQAQPQFNIKNMVYMPKEHYFYQAETASTTPSVHKKMKTSKTLYHFALNISSASATVRDLNLVRPQDFFVTVLHQDASYQVKPSEPFDHIVDISTWLHPQLECSIHQYAPHYFGLKPSATLTIRSLTTFSKYYSLHTSLYSTAPLTDFQPSNLINPKTNGLSIQYKRKEYLNARES